MKLYKYKRMNRNTVDEIINSYLVFSSPLLFNDVYDCQVPVDISKPANKFPNKLKSMIEDIFFDDREYGEILKGRMLPDPVETEVGYFDSVVERNMERQRITCFTDDFNNYPMWAHYADNNKGLCMEFTVDETKDSLWGLLKKVQYVKEIPTICYPEDISNENAFSALFQKTVLTKHEKWSYEDEYRIVLLDTATKPMSKELGLIHYASEELTGVYFGYNCNTKSEEYIQLITELKSRKNRPKLFIRKKNESFFGTYWEEITPA